MKGIYRYLEHRKLWFSWKKLQKFVLGICDAVLYFLFHFIKTIILFFVVHKNSRLNKFHAKSVPIYANVPQFLRSLTTFLFYFWPKVIGSLASHRVCAPKPSRALRVIWEGSSRFLGPTSERPVQTPPSVHRGAIWDFDLYLFHIFSPSIEWKASKYRVISGQYFPVFRLNTERYVTPYLDTFHAVIKWAYAVVKLKLS